MRVIEVILGLFAVAGMAIIGIGMIQYEAERAHRVRKWPRASGQISTSSAKSGQHDDGRTIHYVSVAYTYSVMGREYQGSDDNIVGPYASRSQAEDARDSYPPGLELPIAYNPKRPEESHIADTRHQCINLWVFPLGVACILFGIVVGGNVLLGRWKLFP